MSERGAQLQQLLATLSRHSDLVAEAFDGSVSGGDRDRNAGIESLFAIGVLKPYDEDSYRLNPRLREFFSDHFASYNAFQALRRVSTTMAQAEEQWRELRRLRNAGSAGDQARLFYAFDESVADMGHSIDHNLGMLHALLATQYGNVDDLTSKLRQNRYYARQVATFLRDVQGISAFVEQVADEATAAGLADVRTLVMRRLGARYFHWTAQIKDAQATISKRLFQAKLMEERLRRLSRYALWLGRHRTAAGWDLPVDETAPVELVRMEPIILRMQPDVRDTDLLVHEGLVAAAVKLPREKSTPQVPAEPEEHRVAADEIAPFVERLTPVQRAVDDLVDAVLVTDEPISLLEWKSKRADLDDLLDGAWLMFAGLQLKGGGLALSFVGSPYLDRFAINESFQDIEVRRAQLA